MFDRQWRALMRKGMLTVAGSLPAPRLHRETKGFKQFLQGNIERNRSHGRTFWLSFMLCLSPFSCHRKVSPRGRTAARTDERCVYLSGQGTEMAQSPECRTDWAGRVWN